MTKPKDLDELFEDYPVGDPRSVAAERMSRVLDRAGGKPARFCHMGPCGEAGVKNVRARPLCGRCQADQVGAGLPQPGRGSGVAGGLGGGLGLAVGEVPAGDALDLR
jgi:hypothetical protein